MLNTYIYQQLPLHVSAFATSPSGKHLLYLLKNCMFCNVDIKCKMYPVFLIYNAVTVFQTHMYFLLLYLKNLKNLR